MRLAIVGKTRSGKSTALHQILSHALRHTWDGILLLDGKGSELMSYKNLPGVTYLGADAIDQWAFRLEQIANGMPVRYQELIRRGLREAPASDPRWLIVTDEIQRGTRHPEFGKSIKNSLVLISEQSAALNDVLIFCTQREINAVPPSARHNVNVWLRMLGTGYFHMQRDGQPTLSGRTAYTTPEKAISDIQSNSDPLPFDTEHLADILGRQQIMPGRATVTHYVGEEGSGKTWHLQNHRAPKCSRTVFVDLALSHKAMLIHLIEHCNAIAPTRVGTADLIEIATLALQSEPTLLLMDNLHLASAGMITTIQRLIESAAEVAISSLPAKNAVERRKTEFLVSRAIQQEIKPQPRTTALAIVRANLPVKVTDPQTVERHILQLGKGHPATLRNLALQTRRGTVEEIREYRSLQTEPTNLTWLALISLFIFLLWWRADGYVMVAFAGFIFYALRRYVMRRLWGMR